MLELAVKKARELGLRVEEGDVFELAARVAGGKPVRIIGTLDVVEGTALLDSVEMGEGEIIRNYAGETKMDWDSQDTMVDKDGLMLFVGEDHVVYNESELELVPCDRPDDDRSEAEE